MNTSSPKIKLLKLMKHILAFIAAKLFVRAHAASNTVNYNILCNGTTWNPSNLRTRYTPREFLHNSLSLVNEPGLAVVDVQLCEDATVIHYEWAHWPTTIAYSQSQSTTVSKRYCRCRQ